MLTHILNLKGAQELKKKEQVVINGGTGRNCTPFGECPAPEVCINGRCVAC
jgi:hypothetical protein